MHNNKIYDCIKAHKLYEGKQALIQTDFGRIDTDVLQSYVAARMEDELNPETPTLQLVVHLASALALRCHAYEHSRHLAVTSFLVLFKPFITHDDDTGDLICSISLQLQKEP